MTPEEEVDELLAAPELTKLNDTEQRKYRQRKSKEEAHAARIAQSKSTEEPTIEDMLADMIRVAEDPNLNNWYETRVLGRKLYEIHGKFFLSDIFNQFGTWAYASEVAGLRDQAGTRLRRGARSIASRKEHAARYLKRYALPYAPKPEDYRELDGSYLILSISDTHALFLNIFVWHSFLSAIKDLRPDCVLLNGDILEGAEISRHPKIPGWTVPLQMEFDFVYEMLRQIRQVFDGDLIFTGGNHGVDRLAMYLTQEAKGLSSLRTLRIDKLLGLDEFDVQLFQGGTISSPEGTENDLHGLLMFNCFHIHHGTLLGKTPAMGELMASGYSGISGHVHRGQLFCGTTRRHRALNWMTLPMGCTPLAGRAYVKAGDGWQQGFGKSRIFPNGQVRQQVVLCDGGVCEIEGFVYTRDESIPDPDPMTLWLPDVAVP